MIRANQKGPIEGGERAGGLVDYNVETGAEMSRSPDVIEAREERLDEAGIT
jgi:hypothetical protein